MLIYIYIYIYILFFFHGLNIYISNIYLFIIIILYYIYIYWVSQKHYSRIHLRRVTSFSPVTIWWPWSGMLDQVYHVSTRQVEEKLNSISSSLFWLLALLKTYQFMSRYHSPTMLQSVTMLKLIIRYKWILLERLICNQWQPHLPLIIKIIWPNLLSI